MYIHNLPTPHPHHPIPNPRTKYTPPPSTAALAFENGTIAPIAAIKGSKAYEFLLTPPDSKTDAPNP